MSRKWLDCGYILKADLTRFAAVLNVRWERKKKVKCDSKVFGLRNWKDEIATYGKGKIAEEVW